MSKQDNPNKISKLIGNLIESFFSEVNSFVDESQKLTDGTFNFDLNTINNDIEPTFQKSTETEFGTNGCTGPTGCTGPSRLTKKSNSYMDLTGGCTGPTGCIGPTKLKESNVCTGPTGCKALMEDDKSYFNFDDYNNYFEYPSYNLERFYDRYVYYFYVPDFEKSNISVSEDSGFLKVQSTKQTNRVYIYKEHDDILEFNRSVLLEDDVARDTIRAELKNGVLQVTIERENNISKMNNERFIDID